MYKLVVLMALVILVSCSPQKRLARLLERHPIPADTVVKDTTIYRDSIIYVQLPGDTVEKIVALEVPVDLPDTTLKVWTDYARAMAGLSNNNLWLELVQTDTMFVVKLDSVIVKEEVEKIITKIVVEPGPSVFWKHGFLVLAGLILIGLILLFLLKR